jgi:hypothetical protein
MASHPTTSKSLHQSGSDDNLSGMGSNNSDDGRDEVKVISNPNAEVDGLTIRQWSEVELIKLINTPAKAPNGFNDPQGTVAAAINSPHSKMFFITGVPPSDTAPRTFMIHHGQDVFLPVNVDTDAEGQGISSTLGPGFGGPGQPSFADEVRQVLAQVKFSDLMVTVDGKEVKNLQETNTGVFSAGVAQQGTAAVPFFGATPGASLANTGQVGFFAVFRDLGKGTHTITASSTITFQGQSLTQTHTDIIKVV